MFEQLNSVRQCLRVVHLIFPALLFGIGAFAPENRPPRTTTHSQIPLAFERNQGQSTPDVRFIARGARATLYLNNHSAKLESSAHHSLTMRWINNNSAPVISGEDRLEKQSNYFIGADPNQWTNNISNFEKVRYEKIYPGIDLLFYGNDRELEYDFLVAPHSNPHTIKFKFDEAENIFINQDGELVLKNSNAEMIQRKPIAYQMIQGEKISVAANYVLSKNNEISFAVGNYHQDFPLIIDPVISYASYVGEDLNSQPVIATDAQGNAYIARTFGVPATNGAVQNGSMISITKINPNGTAVLYSAVIGGGDQDQAYGITVDSNGNCYVAGKTNSSLFPTTAGAFQTDFGLACGTCSNAFVTKINPQGNTLIYSTYVKGEATQISEKKLTVARAVAVDATGNAFITGDTNVSDFPVTPNALQPTMTTYRGLPSQDAFVTKLNPSGSQIIYSTYLGGGDNTDKGMGIAVDAAGNAFIGGVTSNGIVGVTRPQGTIFPTTATSYQTTDTRGLGEFIPSYAFAAKVNPNGTALLYSALIGTVNSSIPPFGFGIDNAGSTYLTGFTRSKTFPVTANAFRKNFGSNPDDGGEAFITKLNANGSALAYSTYLGGTGANTGDYATNLAIDEAGNAIITGLTNSPDFPQTGTPAAITQAGGFVTKLNATGSAIIESTYLSQGVPEKIALDRSGNVFLTGFASEDFHPTSNAFQTEIGAVYLIKLSAPRVATTVSAASYLGAKIACEGIASVFGAELSATTQAANTIPLPTSLGGTSVKVKDSLGVERDAPIFFISPTQINFQIPPGTASGMATIMILSSVGGVSVSTIEIVVVAPSLFSADSTGKGLAAAQVQRSTSTAFESVVKFDLSRGQFAALPIDLSSQNEQAFLILYGTGIRLRSSLNQVTAKIGSLTLPVDYAGSQNGYVGLDQVNVLLPRSLIGSGLIEVGLTVEGKVTNTVQIFVK